MGNVHKNLSDFFNAHLRIDPIRGRNLIFAGFALFMMFCLPATADTITVCPSGCNYTTIQDAIYNAQPGDTIEVTSGSYDPTLLVNKSVTIIGIDTGSGIPIIGDDGITIAAVTISAENVTLDNLRIIGSVRTAIEIEANCTTLRRIRAESIDQEDQARIPVIHAAENLTQITIADSVIRTNGGTGIYIEDGSDLTITNNTVTVNRSASFTREAIWAEYEQDKVTFFDITITDNIVEGGMIDVGALSRFENMPHPVIENILVHNNTVTHCSPSGIQIIGNVHVTTDQEYIYDLINVTVTNNKVLDYDIRSGIEVSWANGGVISGNTVEDGFGGIAGLRLAQGANFTVTDNTVTRCTGGQQIVGFDLREVKESNIRGNTMTENQMNFAYTPGGELRPNMTIDTTNTADGRPIYYYEGKNNFTVDDAQDPACLILVNCGNVMVENVTPSKNDAGLVVYNSQDVVVQSSNIHDCYNGIILPMSSNCDIRNNTIDSCSNGAIIFDLHDSLITNNLFTGNGGAIAHYASSENTQITNNTIRDNGYGIWTYFIQDGSSISYAGNTLEVGDYGICVISSDSLSFAGNVIRNFNNTAIQARISQSNVFRDNIIENLGEEAADSLAVQLVNAANINNQTIYRGGNHTLVNNYINTSAHVSIENEIPGEPIDAIMPRWLESVSLPELPQEDDILPDIWNLTKTTGPNIVKGPYLGGNYWAHPNGTGWSQVHHDRGDGFCDAPYVFDDINIDYLPLHRKITVCPSGCDFSSIQEAINAASNGDTIEISSGTYPEAIEVNKTLTLIGVNGTPVLGCVDSDASVLIAADGTTLENLKITTGQRWCVNIAANNTILRSLDITGHNPEDIHDEAINGGDITGVWIEQCTVQSEGLKGIVLSNTTRVNITDCLITTDTPQGTYGHSGINITYRVTDAILSDVHIINNTIVGGSLGLTTLSPVSDALICGNTVTESDSGGIYLVGNMVQFIQCDNLTVSENRIDNINSVNPNIFISGLSGGTIEDNIVQDSYEGADGFDLSYLDQFVIQGNSVHNGSANAQFGTVAFNLEVITNSVVSGNTVTNVEPYSFRYSPGPNFYPNLTFDSSNAADGLPVLFYEGESGISIDGQDLAMVVMLSCSDMEIRDSNIVNTGLGAGIYGCSGTTVSGTRFENANNGMMLIQSTDSVVENNVFKGSWMGVGIGDNTNASVCGNTFSEYLDSGIVIHTGDSHDVVIYENTFNGTMSGREQGIAANGIIGSGVTVANNTMSENSRGILIEFASNLTVQGNLIEDCGVGVDMTAAINNTISGNTIRSSADDYMGIFILNNESMIGAGVCENNQFFNNYIESVTPLFITTGVEADSGMPMEFGPIWGPKIQGRVPSESGDTFPKNFWNTTKTSGQNIMGGPYLGGNYWAKPNGTGWSQMTPDRGDGFCNAPFVFDTNNTDYLPLHLYTPKPDPEQKYNFKSISSGDQIATDIGEGVSKNRVTIITRQS